MKKKAVHTGPRWLNLTDEVPPKNWWKPAKSPVDAALLAVKAYLSGQSFEWFNGCTWETMSSVYPLTLLYSDMPFIRPCRKARNK